ncbi:MAG: hypothetical protein U9Q70_09685, partial [Chloroflexota bacterium]|nr:hypothetical protein [Chloroflexota bacterium]
VDRLAPDTLERPNGNAQTDFFQLVAWGPQWGDLDLARGDRVLALAKPRSEDITTQDGVERVSTFFRVAQLSSEVVDSSRARR